MDLIAEFHPGIEKIDRDAWDTCAAGRSPFTRYDFLAALEQSGCVSEQTGWIPHHLTISLQNSSPAENAEQPPTLLAVCPLYVKLHSAGEYVFDQGWADAYERAGGRYYPKLLSAIPFTPVTSCKILISPATGEESAVTIRTTAMRAILERCDSLSFSSAHFNFLRPEDIQAAKNNDLLLRQDQQFHWFNKGYETFGDFLATLTSRKRKQIRKERQTVLDSDIEIRAIEGKGVSEADLDAFFQFYLDTGARKWGHPYLNRKFFSCIRQTMPDDMLLFLCYRNDRPIAGALNFIGPDTLYGRYWGCIEDHPCLHFETCYYQAIDYAITHKLSTVEAGAQGPHKIARGYEPSRTISAHYIRDERFRAAVDDFLKREGHQIDYEAEYLSKHLPFKKSDT
ncbi:hypothetical protein GCM10017044_26450 [Kordiimonas sediminis]|uniref:GNAT family N-acetyltransferase n=1 Tax=Kordiimonas sediminis TaxID=1735581 RepID=A0A919AX16_9PROT|nr:GNAT family N-acetyltransferase [Kordiimonas sediminis]GHF29862.1 hypothetical protein GCM10017044_26450 [Kordiimonas sediminis]